MKVIFLDIEGVLVLDKSNEPHEDYAHPFDKECVAILNELLDETGAEIVITSSWKKMLDLKRLTFIFNWNGVTCSPHDITFDFNNREKEITDYVQRMKINDFVILDDMDLTVFPKNFVKCNSTLGLKESDKKEQALNALKSKFSKIS